MVPADAAVLLAAAKTACICCSETPAVLSMVEMAPAVFVLIDSYTSHTLCGGDFGVCCGLFCLKVCYLCVDAHCILCSAKYSAVIKMVQTRVVYPNVILVPMRKLPLPAHFFSLNLNICPGGLWYPNTGVSTWGVFWNTLYLYSGQNGNFLMGTSITSPMFGPPNYGAVLCNTHRTKRANGPVRSAQCV